MFLLQVIRPAGPPKPPPIVPLLETGTVESLNRNAIDTVVAAASLSPTTHNYAAATASDAFIIGGNVATNTVTAPFRGFNHCIRITSRFFGAQ